MIRIRRAKPAGTAPARRLWLFIDGLVLMALLYASIFIAHAVARSPLSFLLLFFLLAWGAAMVARLLSHWLARFRGPG